MTKLHSIKEFEELSKKIIENQDSKDHIISISSGTCGHASGSIEVEKALKQAVKGYEDKIDLTDRMPRILCGRTQYNNIP